VGTDYQALARDFKIGDVVHRAFPTWVAMSPFVGRITSVFPGIGCCDVQWPYGNERVPVDEIVRSNPGFLPYLPPTLDQSFQTLEVLKARQAATSVWRTTSLPQGFHLDMARLWARQASEVAAYDELWRRYANVAADDAIRDEVDKFYTVGRNLPIVLIQAAARTKSAAYWVAQNRQYRATKEEFSARKPGCPRCSTTMRRTTYKMKEGAKHRLFGCPRCLFLIKTNDLLAPDGAAVEW